MCKLYLPASIGCYGYASASDVFLFSDISLSFWFTTTQETHIASKHLFHKIHINVISKQPTPFPRHFISRTFPAVTLCVSDWFPSMLRVCLTMCSPTSPYYAPLTEHCSDQHHQHLASTFHSCSKAYSMCLIYLLFNFNF